jgi:Pyridine nucleotide-disulphide oxidoreductase
VVWAAGVKAADVLHEIDGLETNRINQLIVKTTLQTTRDEAIYAFGDCAACPWPDGDGAASTRLVPPRAQAAHQQASHLARELPRVIAGKPPRPWQYRDFARIAGPLQHRGQPDGRAGGRQPDGGRQLRAADVRIAVQDARAGASRRGEGGAGNAGADDRAAH